MKINYVLVLIVLLFASCKPNASAPAKAAEAPKVAEPVTPAAPAAPDYAVGGFSDVKAFEAFYTKFQFAIGSPKMQKEVAAMVAYPIKGAKNAKEFIANYDKIVTPKVKESVKNQTFDKLFCRDQGCMVGDGQVWFATNEKGAPVIKTFNP